MIDLFLMTRPLPACWEAATLGVKRNTEYLRQKG